MTCLDTAHLFEAGFDISTAKGFWDTIAEFDRIVGRDRLAALHLNDSKTPLGSHVDRHDHIGKGKSGSRRFWRSCGRQSLMPSRRFSRLQKTKILRKMS